MLTLKLTLDNGQVTICVNEAQSHSFSLHDLRLNDAELKAFVLNPRPYGSRLFKALFKDGSAAKKAFDELSKQMARTIVLVLDSPVLDSVAWEYAYNEGKQEYVVEDCAFMRALPESERPANGRLKESVERVSLLFIPANPLVDLNAEPMRALDVDGEWREMTRHITASHAPFDLLQLRPATPEQLQTSMAHFRDGLAVHFSGHGAAMRDGTILLFERENGASNPLGAQEFIRAVKDKAGIVFLSACQSAAAEKTEFGNLARGLVKSGVPFALGMQFNLPDPFAPVISGQFYNWLAQGHAIPEATMQARCAVKRENEFFVGMIALYAAHPDETGEMNWRGSSASLAQTFRPADVSDLPSPASGLIGRQRELMRIGTKLIEGTRSGPLTVTLHGAGGIGKTALLWQSLLRFAPSFDLTLALALDPLPSLESILGRIERFLGLPLPCANETNERETLIRERLTSKRTLLGLDNFETLNYALNEKDSDEEKTSKSLHTFFKSLAANGVTLCVTSREKTGLPGEHVEEVYGFEDNIGGAFFCNNVSTRKDALSKEGAEKLSAIVGGHPLALRLLAPVFEEQAQLTLEAFAQKLQTFLPKASDKWTSQQRHQSLRACFSFSIDNLMKTEDGQSLQVALSRLSLFTAFFAPIFVAPVIENKWQETEKEIDDQSDNAERVTHALWERGLIERVAIALPNENFYLYRLHPTLGIFAKERLTDSETVKENYWKSMSHFAVIAAEQITKSPLIAQIVLRAIPDLLIAAEARNDESAASMQVRVSNVIQRFGLYDEALYLLTKARDIYTALNQNKGLSVALTNMANIYVSRGDLDEAMKLYQQSLEIFDDLGDLKNRAATLHYMAHLCVSRNDLDQAMNLYQQVVQTFGVTGDSQEKAATLHDMAYIHVRRGNLDEAVNLYRQSLEINEKIDNLLGISQTLHDLADIHIIRGDLDGAMNLYQQSLEIAEGLNDLEGKAANLNGIGFLLFQNNRYKEALTSSLSALEIRIQLQVKQGIESTISFLNYFQQAIGVEAFKKLWEEVTGGEQLPDWLSQQPEEEQGMTTEQFIAGAIQSAREKRPEAEQYFKEVQRLAGSADVPAELQELGKVLQKIMLGAPADLSTLTGELREMVEKIMRRDI